MKKIILVGLSLLALSCLTTQKVAQSSSSEEEKATFYLTISGESLGQCTAEC